MYLNVLAWEGCQLTSKKKYLKPVKCDKAGL